MRRVLVVDDETLIGEIVADLLASDGYVVDTAANGSEALELIHRWHPDAVVLDMMMPEVAAWDFLARYSADTVCHGLPVAVLATTLTTEVGLEEVGVSAVIPNPFDLQHLLETIQALIKHKHASSATTTDLLTSRATRASTCSDSMPSPEQTASAA
jgi:DNA-binding response OmpR family regulator